MRWFDEQIRQRKSQEDIVLSEALYEIAGAISGKNKKPYNKSEPKQKEGQVRFIVILIALF